MTYARDILIIGGGPAGMMAAYVAASEGKKVTILEKNPDLGMKLSMTGGGRCNILNNEPDMRTLLTHYGDAGKFLFSSFSRFGLAEAIDFFESRGLPLVTEANNRMFPASQRASDVAGFFKDHIKKVGVEVMSNTSVTGVAHDRVTQLFSITTASGDRYTARRVIIATGGLSRPETGSTGDGYSFLRALGHTAHDPSPDIVPLRTSKKDPWVFTLAGTSLQHMRITFSQGDERFSKVGRLLFTHFGLSGPLILNSAKQVGEMLAYGPVRAHIDLFPDMPFDLLEKQVIATLSEHSNKTFQNALALIVPQGMAKALIGLCTIAPETKAHSISREDRRALIHLLKGLPLEVVGRLGMSRAVVSDGGVPLEEVDTRTFESKKIPGLFLVGDTLHIPRPSGGYSLQLCWTTGYCAGMNV